MERLKTYKDFGKVVLGHSKDFSFNELWQEQGLLCGWEHCIETMGLVSGHGDKGRCPIFAHVCLGGEEQVIRCKNITTELWHKVDERFK